MKKLAVLLICLFCLTSCSVKLAYKFLDFAMGWQLKRYVSLEGEQKDFAENKIDEFHAWHRRTQLPLYAAYIDTVLNYIQNENVDGEWIHGETDKVQLMLDDSVNFLKPSIIELAAGFSDEQVAEVMERFEKNREKFYKKYVDVSDQKRRDKQEDELKDSIGPFFGRLTDEQEAMIETWLDALKSYEALALKQQEVWSEKLQQALAQRENREALTQGLEQVMFYRTDDWDPELEAILDHNQEISYRLLADLYNSQTSKQREKTLKKLRDYRDDFLELAAEAE